MSEPTVYDDDLAPKRAVSIKLSIVIPAYNESARLPPYLDDIYDYIYNDLLYECEVIVVDDGSRDDLSTILMKRTGRWPRLSLVHHSRNLGKGAALRTGILAAAGELVLLTDADGATPIEEEARLNEAIELGAHIAIGSRLTCGADVSVRRSWHRERCSQTFAWLARKALRLPVRDTQCGFKMFRRCVGEQILPLCIEQGYLFDLEFLAFAHHLGYQIAEVAVSWSDLPGSKMRLARDAVTMICGLGRIRRKIRGLRKGDLRNDGLAGPLPRERPADQGS